MSDTYKTEQEAFWAGNFGDDTTLLNDESKCLLP